MYHHLFKEASNHIRRLVAQGTMSRWLGFLVFFSSAMVQLFVKIIGGSALMCITSKSEVGQMMSETLNRQSVLHELRHLSWIVR